MFSFFTLSRFGREVQSRRGRRPLACKPRLEALEDRNLLTSWTTVAPMPTARGLLAGVAGSDARLYAIGGTAAFPTGLATVEAYNTDTDSWTARAPLNTPRAELAAALGLDGRIYAFGGVNGGVSPTGLTSVEVYRSNNSWSFVHSMNTGRATPAGATGSDGRIYAIGGLTTIANIGSVTNTVERYITGTDTWSFVAPLHTARWGASAATGPDGRTYVFGGFDAAGNPLSSVEAYRPTLNTWTVVAPMPFARALTAAVQGPNGRLFVIDGSTGNNSIGPTTNVVQSYNPDTDSWSTVVTTGTPGVSRSALAAALGDDGRVYAFGGFNNAFMALAVNQRLQAFSGFAAPPSAKNPTAVIGVPDSAMPATTNLIAASLSGATSQWVDPSSRASDNTAGRDGTDAVFALGVDSLAADPVDTLFASGIGA